MTQTHTQCKTVEPEKFPARRRNLLAALFAAALAASVAAQFAITPRPYFGIDGHFWFYPVAGFAASIVLVLVSRMLGFILRRRESYWEDKA